jgi:hypothetical protein
VAGRQQSIRQCKKHLHSAGCGTYQVLLRVCDLVLALVQRLVHIRHEMLTELLPLFVATRHSPSTSECALDHTGKIHGLRMLVKPACCC